MFSTNHEIRVELTFNDLLECIEKAATGEKVLFEDKFGPTTGRIVLNNYEVDKSKALEQIGRIAERLM